MNASASITPLSRGRGVGIVAFLFGVAARAELPGPVLHRLLADVGMAPAAARALVARMRREGQIASTRRGRSSDYRLAGEFAVAFNRVRDAPTLSWSGSFHAVLYQVPESARPFRDLLRRMALFAGYGLLQQGVLIALTDRRHALAETLAKMPDGARVYLTELAMSTPDAARAAFDAWQLGPLARRYEEHIDTLTRALRALPPDPPATADTLRTFVDLLQVPLSETLRNPGLPPELLPPDWPGHRLRRVNVEVGERLGPAAHRYVTDVLG